MNKVLLALGTVGSVIWIAIIATTLLAPDALPPEAEYALLLPLFLFGIGFLGLYTGHRHVAGLAATGLLWLFAFYALLRLTGVVATSTETVVAGRVIWLVALLSMGVSAWTTRKTNLFSIPAAGLFIVWGFVAVLDPYVYDIATDLWNVGQLVAVGVGTLGYFVLQLR